MPEIIDTHDDGTTGKRTSGGGAARGTKRGTQRGSRGGPRKSAEQIRAEVEALNEQLSAAVQELGSDEQWRAMLRIAARAPRNYSLSNVLRLWAQAAQRGMTLTHVAGYAAWKEMGRQVRKNETGLRVVAPHRVRLTEDEAAERGPSGLDDQGRPVHVVAGFRPQSVFDISQTEGPPLPDATSHRIAGAAPEGLWNALRELIGREGFGVELRVPEDGSDGFVDYTRRVVVVRDDVDPAEQVAVAAHELGHILAGHETRREYTGAPRKQRETEAESIAFVVCTARGLDTTRAATPYVTGWSGGDVDLLQAAAETVHAIATRILSDLDALDAPSGGVDDRRGDAAQAGATPTGTAPGTAPGDAGTGAGVDELRAVA